MSPGTRLVGGDSVENAETAFLEVTQIEKIADRDKVFITPEIVGC